MATDLLIEFPKLGIAVTLNPNAISIGGFSIQWYGILIGIGFLLAVLYGFRRAPKMGIDEDKLVDAIIWGLIGGVVGARLYYIIFYDGVFFTEATFMDNFLKIFKIKQGGLGLFGGLIGAVIGGGLTAKVRKIKILPLFDLVFTCFFIGIAIGRWGNFFNQEAFGTPTDLPWGMQSVNTNNVPVHPCFLYEFLACTAGFLFLSNFTAKHRRYDGQSVLLFLLWYGIVRFFVEGLRTDSLVIANTGLRVSQVLSAAGVLAALILLVYFRNRRVLTGCGNPAIMAENAAKIEQSEEGTVTEADQDAPKGDKAQFSTIFGDLSPADEKTEGLEAAEGDKEAADVERPPKSQNKDDKDHNRQKSEHDRKEDEST